VCAIQSGPLGFPKTVARKGPQRVKSRPTSGDAEVFAMNDRIWTPPHLLALRSPATRYDCSRISGLSVTSVSRGRAYSRVGSSLVTRASRP
jgi:hypothetical protein